MSATEQQTIQIAASILSADLARLGKQVEQALEEGVRWIHIDAMDGYCVPNLGLSPQTVACLRPIAERFGARLHAHLMLTDPDRYLADFIRAGANSVSVHIESCPHLHRTLQEIRSLGAGCGVALNPATSLATLEEIAGEIDFVMVMSVEPGFGGQEFISASLDKIVRLRRMLDGRGLEQVLIAVDGGIHPRTAAAVVRAGARVLVAGSAIFNTAASVADNLRELRASFAASV